MTYWLIQPEALEAIEQARTRLRPSDDQVRAFAASSGSVDTSQVLDIAGPVATIRVHGVLTRTPDLWLRYFGEANTAYSEIQAALTQANEDPQVETIILDVDSPGGMTSGLFETIEALQTSPKPIKAVVDMAASAAYGIASAAGHIEARGPGSSFGSIGVVASYYVSSYFVDITSTDAPAKRPDVSTDEGKAVVREHLDEIHALFAEAISKGRKTTTEAVNQTFGQGRMFLAAEAQRRGMIDAIYRPAPRAVSSPAPRGTNSGSAVMKFSEFRAAHPEEAEAALANATTLERERVQAHLTMGEQCGDMSIAIDAIIQGIPFGHAPTQAKYLAKAANRRDIAARAADDAPVIEATQAAEAPASPDLGDQLAAFYAPSKESK